MTDKIMKHIFWFLCLLWIYSLAVVLFTLFMEYDCLKEFALVPVFFCGELWGICKEIIEGKK